MTFQLAERPSQSQAPPLDSQSRAPSPLLTVPSGPGTTAPWETLKSDPVHYMQSLRTVKAATEKGQLKKKKTTYNSNRMGNTKSTAPPKLSTVTTARRLALIPRPAPSTLITASGPHVDSRQGGRCRRRHKGSPRSPARGVGLPFILERSLWRQCGNSKQHCFGRRETLASTEYTFCAWSELIIWSNSTSTFIP